MIAYRALVLAGLGWLASGCASLEGADYGVYDEYPSFNRFSYELTDAVDDAVLAPVARGYQAVLPGFVETGISNVFANMRTMPSALNGFLQGKPQRGLVDTGRFLVNTTLGVGGLFDPATGMRLYPQNEDFGQTLAVWGWRKSRYIYLPFLGPTTIRDFPSRLVSSAMPRLILGHEYNWGVGVLDTVSSRAELLATSDIRDASALDAYTFTRDGYVQRRKFLIYDGRPPMEDLFDDFDAFDTDDEDL